MCLHAFVAITLREMRERGTNMRERCSRYSFIQDIISLDVLTLNSSSNMRERCSRFSFIQDISSLDVLTLNSSSTQVLLVLVSIRFPRPVLLHSG